jgi:hypothetical protein
VGERRNWFAEERERFTVALGGWLVVVLASCGGAGGSSGWWLERRGERGRKQTAETGIKGLVFGQL